VGFVKRNIELEELLDSKGILWDFMSDADYRRILGEYDKVIESGEYSESSGDAAFARFQNKLPSNGFIFSAPKHGLFSIYADGGENLTFGYTVSAFDRIERATLNEIECVFSGESLTFACVFNHEWQAMCPELFIEKNV
jgi:hypothetical protein